MLCARETSLAPHPVLRKRGAAHRRAPVRPQAHLLRSLHAGARGRDRTLPPLAHVIERPGSCRGQEGPRLACARFVLPAGERLLARRVGADKETGRFRERPGESGVAHFGARGAGALPRRGLGPWDEVAVRHAIVHARDAMAVVDCLPQHQAQNRAEPRDRTQQSARGGGGKRAVGTACGGSY